MRTDKMCNAFGLVYATTTSYNNNNKRMDFGMLQKCI